VDGRQLDELEVALAVGRLDVDLVASFLADDGTADGGGDRDPAPLGVGVLGIIS